MRDTWRTGHIFSPSAAVCGKQKATRIKANAVLDLKPALKTLKTAKLFEFIKQEREIHTRKTSNTIRAAGNSFTSYLPLGKTARLDAKQCQELEENPHFFFLR